RGRGPRALRDGRAHAAPPHVDVDARDADDVPVLERRRHSRRDAPPLNQRAVAAAEVFHFQASARVKHRMIARRGGLVDHDVAALAAPDGHVATRLDLHVLHPCFVRHEQGKTGLFAAIRLQRRIGIGRAQRLGTGSAALLQRARLLAIIGFERVSRHPFSSSVVRVPDASWPAFRLPSVGDRTMMPRRVWGPRVERTGYARASMKRWVLGAVLAGTLGAGTVGCSDDEDGGAGGSGGSAASGGSGGTGGSTGGTGGSTGGTGGSTGGTGGSTGGTGGDA